MSPYRKALVAAAGVLLVVGQALADGDVDAAEVGVIATAVATALGVFYARNTPEV
jgi:hypothetical protein